MKKALLCFLLLLFTLSLSLSPLAAASPVTVIDACGILSDGERDSVATLPDGEAVADGVRYYFVTYLSDYAEDYPTNDEVIRICGFSPNEPSVVLVFRIYARGNTVSYYYDMYTFNGAEDMISNAKVDEILDDPEVYNNLKAGNAAAGAARFFLLANRACVHHLKMRVPKAILTGVIVGVLVGGGAALTVFLLYRRKRHGESYPLDRYARLSLSSSSDVFVGKSVTRVRVQSSSSSSGGRSGGGHSGGHRGGR